MRTDRHALPAALVLALLAACSSGDNGVSQQLCALASACVGSTLSFSFGQECELLTTAAGVGTTNEEQAVFKAELGCLNSASDCKAFAACVAAPASAAAMCKTAGGGSQSFCSGGYAVQCGQVLDGQTEGQNCKAAGLMCIQAGSGTAVCSTGACTSSTQPKCDGDNLVTCDAFSGALSTTNCKMRVTSSCSGGTGGGTTCQTQVADTCGVVGGTATCVGSGAACDESSFKSKCDGTAIVSCTGGKQARFDCASEDSNLTCQIDSTGAPKCVGVGTQCTDKTPESCKGGVITYCMFGTTTTVDCKSYGLSGCTTSMTNGQTVAACTK